MAGRAARRSYGDTMVQHGVALIGPGDAGAWSPDRDDADFGGSYVRRFASEMNAEDALLLRSGPSRVVAIGLVAGEYQYLDVFDDVNGLDLQHCRRVRWFRLPSEYDMGETGPMASPFARVQNEAALNYVRRFLNSPPTDWQDAPLPALPTEEPVLERAPEMVAGVMSLVQDLYPLFGHDSSFGPQPTEDELVAHFVIPFLRSLGWRPEHVAVKWRRIDVALFSALPRTEDNCRVVIEAKRLTEGVDRALTQAQGYVLELGSPRDIVITDGVRYRMFDSADDYAPCAYANLMRPKRSALALFEKLSRH